MSDTAPTVPATKDVRAQSIDYKRVHDHNGKWKGPAWAYGTDLSREVANGKKRPARMPAKRVNALDRRSNAKEHHKQHNAGKQDVLGSSDDDDVAIESEPDLDTAAAFDGTPRSYDSQDGPVAAQQLLGIAMNKAVERFEDKKTTKLVKDEYDVLDAADSDSEDTRKHVEDDFELL